MKGRGTRKHNFCEELFDAEIGTMVKEPNKKAFKLFDFFANCEYFEEEFDYDEVIALPKKASPGVDGGDGEGQGPVGAGGSYAHLGQDILSTIKVETIGEEGMKIDRMLYEKFEKTVMENPKIVAAVEAGQWDSVIEYVNREVFDKPNDYFSLDKLRKAAGVDRRIGIREILEKIFGLIPRFKSKDQLLEEEFAKFVTDYRPQGDEAIAVPAIKNYFKAYATSNQIRHIIDSKQFTDLATNPVFSSHDMKAVPERYRPLVPAYIKDYVSLNQFTI